MVNLQQTLQDEINARATSGTTQEKLAIIDEMVQGMKEELSLTQYTLDKAIDAMKEYAQDTVKAAKQGNLPEDLIETNQRLGSMINDQTKTVMNIQASLEQLGITQERLAKQLKTEARQALKEGFLERAGAIMDFAMDTTKAVWDAATQIGKETKQALKEFAHGRKEALLDLGNRIGTFFSKSYEQLIDRATQFGKDMAESFRELPQDDKRERLDHKMDLAQRLQKYAADKQKDNPGGISVMRNALVNLANDITAKYADQYIAFATKEVARREEALGKGAAINTYMMNRLQEGLARAKTALAQAKGAEKAEYQPKSHEQTQPKPGQDR